MLRKLFCISGAIAGVGLILVGLTGWPIYTNAREDPLRKADAIVVLGGEHDGREQYGLQLLRDGVAPVLLMSDAYPSSDAAMQRACRTRVENAEVLCKKANEMTTRGEAILTRQLADERGWKTVIVVSWRFHLPRARLIFEQCFSDSPEALIMRSVPRRYDYSLAAWEFRYLYQDVGLAKNMLRASCS
jgi:uncharacterized SAM-binding protein YcdF (DUF218 family)